MPDKIIKSALRIKEQLIQYYLHYHRKELHQINGYEQFTLFDQIPEEEKLLIFQTFDWRTYELPVFVMAVEKYSWIVNTTERFYAIQNRKTEYVDYCEFNGFDSGINKITYPQINPKVAGKVIPFGFKRKGGNMTYWNVPTGSILFAFWNITKKCEFIGQKYLIQEYQNVNSQRSMR